MEIQLHLETQLTYNTHISTMFQWGKWSIIIWLELYVHTDHGYHLLGKTNRSNVVSRETRWTMTVDIEFENWSLINTQKPYGKFHQYHFKLNVTSNNFNLQKSNRNGQPCYTSDSFKKYMATYFNSMWTLLNVNS